MNRYFGFPGDMKYNYRSCSDTEGYMSPEGIQQFNKVIRYQWDMIHASPNKQADRECKYFEELYSLETLAERRHFTLLESDTLEHIGDGYRKFAEQQRHNERVEKSQMSLFDIDYSRPTVAQSSQNTKSRECVAKANHACLCDSIYMREGDIDGEQSL